MKVNKLMLTAAIMFIIAFLIIGCQPKVNENKEVVIPENNQSETQQKEMYTKEQINEILSDGNVNEKITWASDDKMVAYVTKNIENTENIKYSVYVTSVYNKNEMKVIDDLKVSPNIEWKDEGLMITYGDEEKIFTMDKINKIKVNDSTS